MNPHTFNRMPPVPDPLTFSECWCFYWTVLWSQTISHTHTSKHALIPKPNKKHTHHQTVKTIRMCGEGSGKEGEKARERDNWQQQDNRVQWSNDCGRGRGKKETKNNKKRSTSRPTNQMRLNVYTLCKAYTHAMCVWVRKKALCELENKRKLRKDKQKIFQAWRRKKLSTQKQMWNEQAGKWAFTKVCECVCALARMSQGGGGGEIFKLFKSFIVYVRSTASLSLCVWFTAAAACACNVCVFVVCCKPFFFSLQSSQKLVYCQFSTTFCAL